MSSTRISRITVVAGLLACLTACEERKPETPVKPVVSNKPVVSDNGRLISFERPQTTFAASPVAKNPLSGHYLAPAVAVASILRPSRKEANPVIMFDDPELNALYSSYQQSLAHYKRDNEFLDRARDMYVHQAATGRELRQAETGLAESATDLAEKEGRFRMLGFAPEELCRAKPGYVWLMANVPEAIIGDLKKGEQLSVSFASYPADTLQGHITAIGDVVDNTTRTVKVRIALANQNERIKPGMYAKVNISLSVNNTLSVPATALIAVQGRNYVFVKKGNTYERRSVITGQQIGDHILILKGLQENDLVVHEGSMLLKGLSFGY